MSDELVERVARAICLVRVNGQLTRGIAERDIILSEQVDADWPRHVEEARAALSAAHVPALEAVAEAARKYVTAIVDPDGTHLPQFSALRQALAVLDEGRK